MPKTTKPKRPKPAPTPTPTAGAPGPSSGKSPKAGSVETKSNRVMRTAMASMSSQAPKSMPMSDEQFAQMMKMLGTRTKPKEKPGLKPKRGGSRLPLPHKASPKKGKKTEIGEAWGPMPPR